MAEQQEQPEIRPARDEPGLPEGEVNPQEPRKAIPAHTPGSELAEDAPEPEKP